MTDHARRVLIVDDDPLVATLVESLLSGRGFVTASCGDATTARQRVAEFDPDLVILDVNLGGGPTGLQLGYVLARLHPELALMYLTRYPTAVIADRAMAEHARRHAVLSKDDIHDVEVLIAGVEDALRGRRGGAELDIARDEQMSTLTRTQWEVLGLVSDGLTNSAIAERRNTSERAVEKQLRQIYEILGLQSGREVNARVLAALRYRNSMGDTQRRVTTASLD